MRGEERKGKERKGRTQETKKTRWRATRRGSGEKGRGDRRVLVREIGSTPSIAVICGLSSLVESRFSALPERRRVSPDIGIGMRAARLDT